MDSTIETKASTPSEDSSSEGVDALLERIAEQQQAIENRDQAIEDRDLTILRLNEQLAALKHRLFGPSSEKIDPDQLQLFDEAEVHAVDAVEETEVAGHQRRFRGRPKLSDDLPRKEVIHDLPDDQKICPHDGTELKEIAPETSEQLDIIPAKMQVIVHVRKKYVCPCCEGHVATAKKPPQPLGKSWATAGLLAWIIVSKYLDALPLYRQSQMLERLGAHLDRATMAKWMVACGKLIQPLINRLTEHIREHPVVHMDETSVQVLREPGRKATSKSYMWVMAAGPPERRSVIYHYAPSRAAKVAQSLLEDFSGALVCDGYQGYDWLEAAGITRVGCMDHGRRRFVLVSRLESSDKKKAGKPKKMTRAGIALQVMAKLYRIEAEGKNLSPEERHALRQKKARPVLLKLHQWAQKAQPHVPPSSDIGEAIGYLLRQWDNLTRYLQDGRYPISNILVENIIRPFAVGRRNWLFSCSTAGATSSANLYSLVQSAKGHGLEPYTYLRAVFERLPLAQTLEDIDALLPQNIHINHQ